MLLAAGSSPSDGTILVALCVIIFLRLFSYKYVYRLNNFPGPFWASFTNLWRAYYSYRTAANPTGPLIDVHDKYGEVVRIGPNVLYFQKPQAVKDIYNSKKNFVKSDFYPVQAAVNKGRNVHTLFSSPDQIWHKNLRSAINGTFLPASVNNFEQSVDTTVDIYLREMDRRFAGKPGPEGSIDFHEWLLYYSFDVMADLTYSSRHGFIQRGEDVHGIIGFVKAFLAYGFIIRVKAGQIPSVDRWLRHNPFLMWLGRMGIHTSNTFPGAPFAFERMMERRRRYATGERTGPAGRVDLLDAFLAAQREHPETMTDQEVLGLSLSMIIAGSETSAITLTALFYYILKTPGCYDKLQAELDGQLPPATHGCPYYTAKYSKIRSLPYLHACVQEAFRMHPAFGFPFERVVPPGGHTIDGHHVPGGTVVGCNPWVIHRDTEIYGEDSSVYRPERWLDDPERAKAMDRTLLQFGAGKHICLGKNIATLEIYKLVPSFLKTFKLTLENPEKDWNVYNSGTVGISYFRIRIERRTLDPEN